MLQKKCDSFYPCFFLMYMLRFDHSYQGIVALQIRHRCCADGAARLTTKSLWIRLRRPQPRVLLPGTSVVACQCSVTTLMSDSDSVCLLC